MLRRWLWRKWDREILSTLILDFQYVSTEFYPRNLRKMRNRVYSCLVRIRRESTLGGYHFWNQSTESQRSDRIRILFGELCQVSILAMQHDGVLHLDIGSY